MKYKIDWVYSLVIIVSLFLCLSLGIYTKAHAGIFDWFRHEEKIQIEQPKTLDSEIDRLSIKYDVSSTTVRAIIKCESQMYGGAINQNKTPSGEVWSTDYGYLQINDYFHEDEMVKLGLDIHNEWDSLEYGFMLLKSQGLKPWSASKTCFSKQLGV